MNHLATVLFNVCSAVTVDCCVLFPCCVVKKLHSHYRCRLVRRTPYACRPAIDGSVPIVAVRECIVAFGPVSAPRALLGVRAPLVL